MYHNKPYGTSVDIWSYGLLVIKLAKKTKPKLLNKPDDPQLDES